MPLVDARDYSFRYLRGKEPALKNITLSIEPGTVLGVVGKAGAGKSTLLKALMGIVPHIEPGYMEGELVVAGKSIRDNDVSEMAHHVSIVLETPEVQIFSLTVKDDIAFGPANLGLPRQEIWDRVRYAIAESELQGFEDRNPNNLSGGEQQSLALAGALAMRPKLLAMDEPVSMLDPLGKERVMGIMERVTRTGGATTIISESGADIEAIAEKVDRVVALHEGRILVDGGPETLADVRMEEIGVGRPQVSELFDQLRQAGVQVEAIPTTLPAAEEGVRRLLGDRKIKAVRLPGDYRNGRSKRTFGDVIVDVSDLRHTYPPDVRALRGVSLQIRSGEIVGVIGQNGSGKTTMARHLVGLLKPTSKTSRVTVLGGRRHASEDARHHPQDQLRLPERRRPDLRQHHPRGGRLRPGDDGAPQGGGRRPGQGGARDLPPGRARGRLHPVAPRGSEDLPVDRFHLPAQAADPAHR